MEDDVHTLEHQGIDVENRFVAELAVDVRHVDDGVKHADMPEHPAALAAEQNGVALASEDQVPEVRRLSLRRVRSFPIWQPKPLYQPTGRTAMRVGFFARQPAP